MLEVEDRKKDIGVCENKEDIRRGLYGGLGGGETRVLTTFRDGWVSQE